MENLFYPNSIAVVGVSSDERKLGSVYYKNIINNNFPGKVYIVNPKYDSLFNQKCYKSILDIEEQIDQVSILIPAQFVLDTVKQCAIKKVKSILIISAGFGELGEEGKKLEKEILKIAKENNIRILGPNIIGLINNDNSLNSSWMSYMPIKGDISLLSQSGAMCSSILDISLSNNIGFNKFASIGNKIDINELELLKYYFEDTKTKVIGMYLEEINQGYDFLKFLNTTKVKKPTIIFKPGKSNEAKQTIASHTGSLAGQSETVETGLNDAHILNVSSIDNFISDLIIFDRCNLPQGNNVTLITNAGGPGIIATDLIIENKLKLTQLSENTQEQLKEILPGASSVHNPIDILGDALADRYYKAGEIAIKDENTDIILFLLTPQYITEIEKTAESIIQLQQNTDKPIIAVFIGDKDVSRGISILNKNKIACFTSINNAILAISDLVKYSNFIKENLSQDYIKADSLYNKGKYLNEVNHLIKEGKNILDANLTKSLMEEIGLDIPKELVTNDVSEAINFSTNLYPVVIKAPNDVITHKTDVKAIISDIQNEHDLIKEFNNLQEVILKNTNIEKSNIIIQEFIENKAQIIIGANRDGESNVYLEGSHGFGHLIVFGQGGIYTEVYKDIESALIPLNLEKIKTKLEKTNIYKILNGARGLDKLYIDGVINSILSIEKLLLLYPVIESIDINPLLVNEDRAVGVDVKIFLKSIH